jgi:hypothetical protein
LAVKGGTWPRLLEVKANKGSPWMNFRRDDREQLVRAADRVHAVPELVHWPPGQRDPVFLGRDRWPR